MSYFRTHSTEVEEGDSAKETGRQLTFGSFVIVVLSMVITDSHSRLLDCNFTGQVRVDAFHGAKPPVMKN